MYLWGFRAEFIKEANYDFRWFIGLARGAGYTLNLNTALVLLLASRLFLTLLRDTALAEVLPLDKAFPLLHIVVAYAIVSGALVHAVFHFVWLGGWNLWGEWGLWSFKMSVLTGCILSAVFITLFIFARPWMRKKYFRYFYLVHLVGATLFFALLVIHGMYNNVPETYKYVVPALIIYLIDRLVRLYQMETLTVDISPANTATFMDDNVLQLRIPKPFEFRPGQYAEILVPSINREWHPFTIASAQYESTMSFYIKKGGDWTSKLYDEFQARLNGKDEQGDGEDDSLRMRVRGPFGAPTQDAFKYSRVFLISGGIGATPFASMSKELHHRHEVHDAAINYSQRARKGDLKLADHAEQRIRDAVGALYDVDVQALAPVSDDKKDKGKNGNDNNKKQEMRNNSARNDNNTVTITNDNNNDITSFDNNNNNNTSSPTTTTHQQNAHSHAIPMPPPTATAPAITPDNNQGRSSSDGDDTQRHDRDEIAALRMEYVADMLRVASQTMHRSSSTIGVGNDNANNGSGTGMVKAKSMLGGGSGAPQSPRRGLGMGLRSLSSRRSIGFGGGVRSPAQSHGGTQAGGAGGRHVTVPVGRGEDDGDAVEVFSNVGGNLSPRGAAGSGGNRMRANNHNGGGSRMNDTEFEEINLQSQDNMAATIRPPSTSLTRESYDLSTLPSDYDGATTTDGDGDNDIETETETDVFPIDADADADADPATDDASSSAVRRRMKHLTLNLKRQLRRREWFVPARTVSIREATRRQNAARLGDIRSNLLLFLHSSRVIFVIAILYVLRMGISAAGSIFKSGYVNLKFPSDSQRWVPLTYAILSAIPALLTSLTLVLELSVLGGGAALGSARRVAETLMFGPVNIALTAVEFNRFAKRQPGSESLILTQYVLAQALTFALVMGRMWRAVGKKGLLDDAGISAISTNRVDSVVTMNGDEEEGEGGGDSNNGASILADGRRYQQQQEKRNVKFDDGFHIPDADFVWTTREDKDDAWLRRELCDVANGDAVRLHRYVTAKKRPASPSSTPSSATSGNEHTDLGDCELGLSPTKSGKNNNNSNGIMTKSGRPNWEQLLAAAARDTRSDGVVGIFFCGPHIMGQAVRKAAAKVEVWSNLRDAYLRNTDVRTLMRDVGLKDARLVYKLRNFGCRVRFVYHEENFS